MEFEFRPDGKLRYANNSNYKNDVMIRKEGAVMCGAYLRNRVIPFMWLQCLSMRVS